MDWSRSERWLAHSLRREGLAHKCSRARKRICRDDPCLRRFSCLGNLCVQLCFELRQLRVKLHAAPRVAMQTHPTTY